MICFVGLYKKILVWKVQNDDSDFVCSLDKANKRVAPALIKSEISA